MSGLSPRTQTAVRRIAGQPLALLLAVLGLWIWIRTAWLVLNSPTIQPPVSGSWLLDRSQPYALQSLSEEQRPATVLGAHVYAKHSIAMNHTPSGDGSSLTDGMADGAQTKWLRLAALGGRWGLDERSSARAGRGGGSWSAGYRDTFLLDPTMSLLGARSANGIAMPSEDMRPTHPASPWSASAWLLARPGSGSTGSRLIPRYGASQVGAVIEYRLGGHVAPSVYLRASRALVERGEAEIATGIKLDIADLPVNLHIERRFAVHAAGRDAMAMFVSGGFAVGDPSQLALEGYGQAGIVGFRRRTPFADAAVVARRRIGESGPVSVSAGAGGWAGAQPGATRVDVGPRLEARFNDGLQGRLSLDWRERVAGRAEPYSGPAMTLSLSF